MNDIKAARIIIPCMPKLQHDTYCQHLTGSLPKRLDALARITEAAGTSEKPQFGHVVNSDLQFANELIASAITTGSWDRNSAWIQKFGYVRKTTE